MACLTWQVPGQAPNIVDAQNAEMILRRAFSDSGNIFVGHNVAYDMGVVCAQFPHFVPEVFRAYRENRVTDTQIRAQLLDIAQGGRGKYISLEMCAQEWADITLQKDAWRTSYGDFIGVPLGQWPAHALKVQARARAELAALEAIPNWAASKELAKRAQALRDMIASAPEQCVRYPLEDARATLAVYQAQEHHATLLHDQYRQTNAAWALHLMSVWGLRTDGARVAHLRSEIEAALEERKQRLIEAGLMRPNGTKDIKAAKARMVSILRGEGKKIPRDHRTDSHFKSKRKDRQDCPLGDACDEHIALDADACEASDDPLLIDYAAAGQDKKVLGNDVKAFELGAVYPVHTRYGLTRSGRTASSKPAIQNLCNREGIREAFVPREGWLFAEADYPQLELYTLAQCCISWLGQSQLAETLKAGLDPHMVVAVQVINSNLSGEKLTYDDAKRAAKDETHPRYTEVKRARAFAKIANFGFPGGLGLDSAVAYARKSMSLAAFRALGFNREEAGKLKATWFKAYPEMPFYFSRVNALCEASEDGRAFVETLFTRRYRGKATYCAACNSGFQALGSDCAKRAAFLIADAEYAQPTSPLYGCRSVAFIHDEFIVEVPDDLDRADAAARELARLMVVGANEYLPDVPMSLSKMEPLLMRRWSKKAVSTFNPEGKLIPWTPKAA